MRTGTTVCGLCAYAYRGAARSRTIRNKGQHASKYEFELVVELRSSHAELPVAAARCSSSPHPHAYFCLCTFVYCIHYKRYKHCLHASHTICTFTLALNVLNSHSQYLPFGIPNTEQLSFLRFIEHRNHDQTQESDIRLLDLALSTIGTSVCVCIPECPVTYL